MKQQNETKLTKQCLLISLQKSALTTSLPFLLSAKKRKNPTDQKKRWQALEIDPYSTNYISMNPKSLPSPVHNQTISQKSETRRTAIISQTTKSFISFPKPSDTYKNPFKTCTNYEEHNI